MSCKNTIRLVLAVVLLSGSYQVYAENIDPNDDNSQYAYGENVGWLNFEPNVPSDANDYAVTVSDTELTGFVWAENIGWINLDPNDTDTNTGISNDGAGKLSGLAWAENVGWINFDPNVPGDANHYGVTIDSEGNFDGWAWGENIGWINFQSADLFGHNIKACKVNFEDLANFVGQWLETGCNAGNDWCEGADLAEPNTVDFVDYSIFAGYWLDYCPDGWLLK